MSRGFKKICLASQSPRRQMLLQQIGVDFEVFVPDIDETPDGNELPEDYVQRIARQKAESVWFHQDYHRNYPVVAADTAIVIDNTILGKPNNEQDAKDMLQSLSGRQHQVLSGTVVGYDAQFDDRLSHNQVFFRQLTTEEINHYSTIGEGRDKAGGYAIQGLAASFIERIEGNYSSIMGLPLFEVSQLLSLYQVSFWLTQNNQ